MQTTVEISLYPLSENYVDVVWEFIGNIKKHKDIELITNGLSTQIFGDYHHVMKIITDETYQIFLENKAVLVMKLVKGTLKLN